MFIQGETTVVEEETDSWAKLETRKLIQPIKSNITLKKDFIGILRFDKATINMKHKENMIIISKFA